MEDRPIGKAANLACLGVWKPINMTISMEVGERLMERRLKGKAAYFNLLCDVCEPGQNVSRRAFHAPKTQFGAWK